MPSLPISQLPDGGVIQKEGCDGKNGHSQVHDKGVVAVKHGQMLGKDRQLRKEDHDHDDGLRHGAGQSQIIHRDIGQLRLKQDLPQVHKHEHRCSCRGKQCSVHSHPAKDRDGRLQGEPVAEGGYAQCRDQHRNPDVHILLQAVSPVKAVQECIVIHGRCADRSLFFIIIS